MNMLMETADDYRQNLVEEYQHLSNLLILNALQEERVAYILELALQDPLLDELIQRIEFEAISAKDKLVLLDQQAKMREYLGIERGASSLPSTNPYVTRFM